MLKRRPNVRTPMHPLVAPADPASGIAIFAKTPKAQSRWRGAFQVADRVYDAVALDHQSVGDAVLPGTIRGHIERNRRGVFAMVSAGSPLPGSPPVTHIKTIHRREELSLLRIRCRSEHQGQIPAHLASVKRYILGDRAHAPDADTANRDPIGRCCLHLTEVVVKDHASGASRRFIAPPPAAFFEVTGAPAPAKSTGDQPRRVADPDGWDHVAGWYDQMVKDSRADHQRDVIEPGVRHLLAIKPGESVLDVACGPGRLARTYLEDGADQVVGIDASQQLIDIASTDAAQSNAGQSDSAASACQFGVLDAREISRALSEGTLPSPAGGFDAASCVMALMNIDPLEPVFEGIAQALRPGGRFVAVLLHPAFRIPKASDWVEAIDGEGRQMARRISRYLTTSAEQIIMNPGAVADGAEVVTTTTHHRPLEVYINALGLAGLRVDAMEEWASRRTSKPGPRAEAENHARREIPLFLAIRAVREG
jgi:SAM-dependent methyltransferase